MKFSAVRGAQAERLVQNYLVNISFHEKGKDLAQTGLKCRGFLHFLPPGPA